MQNETRKPTKRHPLLKNSIGKKDKFLVRFLIVGLVAWGTFFGKTSLTFAAQKRMNVLFIAVDDLRPQLNCYGEPGIKSPNIDRLADSGTAFENAFCQCASCNPSRSSLLTGCRPDTLKIYRNRLHFRETLPRAITLPQQFKKHGYYTYSIGKIFHGTFKKEIHEDPRSWSAPAWRPRAVQYATPEGLAVLARLYPKIFGKSRKRDEKYMDLRRYKGLAWEAPDVPDNALIDGKLADHAIEQLQQMGNRPFFLAVGFVKPHAPYVAPKKYFDLYDLNSIRLPKNNRVPQKAPALAYHNSHELRGYEGVPKKGPISEKTQKEVIRAYSACVSYVDAQIGRILDELDRLKLRENTIVVLWGDHGYHLGHNGLWCKNTTWDASTRVPLIVSIPGHKNAGQKTKALVELVDIYPTLCNLCSVPLTKDLEGTSFAPLLNDPNRPWKKAAFSQHPNQSKNPQKSMGHSMRTPRYRLTEWTGPKLSTPILELYDYQKDATETINLATDPEKADLLKTLLDQLHAGWKKAVPTKKKNP